MSESSKTRSPALPSQEEYEILRAELDCIHADNAASRKRIDFEERAIQSREPRRLALENFFDVVASVRPATRTSPPSAAQSADAPTPNEERPQPSPTDYRVPRGMWRKVLPKILDEAGCGLTIAELRERARKLPELSNVRFSNHAVEQGAYKLLGRGIVRVGSKYFSKKTYNNASPEELEEAKLPTGREGDVSKTILSLPGLVRGMRAVEIIAELRKDKEMDARLGPKAGVAYNALSRFREQGRLTLDGKIYRLPSEKNEPPQAKASDGSNPGSVNGSNPSLDLNPARSVH